ALTTTEEKIAYARALAGSNLLPRQYQSAPANVLLAVEFGEALGVPPTQAINGIHIVEGKPSASADLIAALIRRAGHKLRITVDDQQLVAVAQLIRADDPEFTYEARWDMAKAQAAGLAGKGNWAKYPGQMLRNRAITEVARMGASDALYGVIYTPEELGADTSPEGNVTVEQVPAQQTAPSQVASIQDAVATHQTMSTPPAEDAPGPEPVAEAPAADDPVDAEPLRTPAQAAQLTRLIKDNDLTADEAVPMFSEWVGRPVTSTKELTADEADTIITRLTADPETGEVPAGDGWPEVAEVAR